MKNSRLALGACVAVLAGAALSSVHPWGNLRAGSNGGGVILSGANAGQETRDVVAQKCGDCHSNNTRWPLYSRVAPASWFVEHDVEEGRKHLNLSNWEQYTVETRVDLLGKMGTQIRTGKMPLKQYLMLHPEARLSEEDRKLISDWLKVERKRLVAEEAK